jgi:vacuolar-type H+-ATPase subunit F/Vma7
MNTNVEKIGVIGRERTIIRFGIAGIKEILEVTKETTVNTVAEFVESSPATIFITEKMWDIPTTKTLIPLTESSLDVAALIQDTLGITLKK